MSNAKKSARRRQQLVIDEVLSARQNLTDWLLSDDLDLKALRNGQREACDDMAAWIQELRDWSAIRDVITSANSHAGALAKGHRVMRLPNGRTVERGPSFGQRLSDSQQRDKIVQAVADLQREKSMEADQLVREQYAEEIRADLELLVKGQWPTLDADDRADVTARWARLIHFLSSDD